MRIKNFYDPFPFTYLHKPDILTKVVTLFYLMRNYFQAPWKIKDLIMALSASVIMFIFFRMGVNYLGLDVAMKESHVKTAHFTLFFMIQWLIFFVPLLFVRPGYKKLTWKNFGFRKYGPLKSIFLIVKGYILYIFISVLIVTIILYSDIRIPGYQVDWSIFHFFDENIISFVIAGLLIVIVGPVLEEIFFRGFILRTMCNGVGVVIGSIISAGLFAALHMPWQNIIPIFILGLIINYIVIKSKSLWPAIGFHVFNNGVAFTLQFLLFREIISLEKLV